MARNETHLVAEPEAVGGARDAEPSVLVGGALVGGGGLVADERQAGIEGQRLQARIDDRAVLCRAAYHRCLHEKARLEGLGRRAVAVEVAAVIGVHEDVRTALQSDVNSACRFEFEDAGAGCRWHSIRWRARSSRVFLAFFVASPIACCLSSQPRKCCAEP